MSNINKLILIICVGLVILGVVMFIKYLITMLSGRCCEGCKSCNQKGNCSNIDRERDGQEK